MSKNEPAELSTKNGHSRCVLCGEHNPLSLKLGFEAGESGSVRTRFDANRVLQGYSDILHGGVIAALLDSAMTHCLFHQGIKALTGDLHVRYLHPIPCDAALEIQARVEYSRPPLYRLKAELLKAGQVMAWASGKFMRQEELSPALDNRQL
jgi:acyl-coenzyme A thioesterase PaaI-like protein